MQKITPKNRSIKKILGIGLLELMLVLALLGVMFIVAIRYYSTANSSQESSALVNSFSTIKSAVENYLADNPTLDPTQVTMQNLILNGYLPSSYGVVSGGKAPANATNLWGGAITVKSTGSTFTVQQTGIPYTVCNMAQGQLGQTLNQNLGESISVSSTKSGSSGSPGSSKSCGASSTIIVTYDQ